MLSAAMVVQEQHGCNGSTSALQIPLDKDTPNANGIQLKEQFNSGDDSTPKARKPYTITKQRERWTEEEHKKFLEALKLYGRAWRKIEEHVGTKTAVQIRSHAQKFFSKVVRESNTGEGNPVKPIEIPPPRPKRKPMHPYPRKLIYPVKTRVTVPENPTMSASPSTLEQENQSPTSVLSAVGSDSSVGAYSCMPNGSPSSASSALALDVFDSEVPKRVVLEEDIISSLPDREEKNSCADEQIHLELDLSSQDTASDKQDSNESATRSLKLFGKTLLINSTCMPESIDKTKGTHLLPWSVVPLELPPNAFSDRSPTLVYNPMDDAACQVPFPWLKICSDASYLTLEVHNPTPVKAQALCDKKEEMFNDEQKEDVYSTGSNTDLVGKRWDVDSYSRLSPQRKGKEEKSFSSYKLSRKMSGSSVNSRRGFVPYKRCSAEQDSSISQETGEEREKPLIRLCL